MGWFSRRYVPSRQQPQGGAKKKDLPSGLWVKCESCQEMMYKRDLDANLKVCPKCDHYHRLTASERLDMLIDEGTFVEHFGNLESLDPLTFPEYREKLQKSKSKTGLVDAILTGSARIADMPVAIGVFDFQFLGGSMGSVVGEKITRLAELALAQRIPLLIISAGGGGARMHECMYSLMQMAKTSAAVGELKRAAIPFVSVITNPTMGGVSASYASLGDVILAEPRALTGFAGPRVIEQTIGAKLPEGFQSSEFLLEHGMLDQVVERRDLRKVIILVLSLLTTTRGFQEQVPRTA